MNRIFILLSCFLAFISAGSFTCIAQDIVKTEYVGRGMDGAQRWRAGTEIQKKQGNTYLLTEKGEGVYSSFDGPVSWVSELEYEITKDRVIPLKLLKNVFDEKGNMIRLEKQDYDPENQTVTCLHRDIPRNISRTKEFTLTKPVVNKLLLVPYVQKMLEKGEELSRVQMISEEPGLYDIDIKVIKTEEIEINGKKIKAVKLQFDPRLGLFNAAKAFFPKSYVWHSSSPDFEWLKFQGLEGDISSVKVEVTVENEARSK